MQNSVLRRMCSSLDDKLCGIRNKDLKKAYNAVCQLSKGGLLSCSKHG